MISLDFDAVRRLATVKSLVEPLRRGFIAPICSPARAHYILRPPSESPVALIMPAWRPAGALGVKITTVFPDNPHRGFPSISGAYVLLSGENGQVNAIVDGRALTLLRTAAVSALAADLLVCPAPQVLLMVGTGALSRYLIEGHSAVRKYHSVLIWGRDPVKAEALANEAIACGLPSRPVTDLEAAARSADVISCATMSPHALVKGSWLKSQSYLDLVGSFKVSMRETDDECMRDARIVVDTQDAATESGDLARPLANGVINRTHIISLKECLERGPEILSKERRTVFKSIGVSLADLTVAEELFERSRQENVA